MKIGIPRALFYYYYPRLWESFIISLGMEPVLSSLTSTKTIELAALVSESENCLPVKLLDAHISLLVGQSDMILIPRLISMLKGKVSCPKLGALPDVAHANLRGRAEILSFNIDENREPLGKTLSNVGISLGINHKRSKMAAQEALETMNAHRKTLDTDIGRGDCPRILLLSHPYIIHDEYLAEPIRRKLEEMNIEVCFPPAFVYDKTPDLSAWDTCSRMHQTLIDLDPLEIKGVIQISSFNCGCDSIMVEFFRDVLREKKIFYMVLIIDEHTALGGLETRLEAFVDSMGW